jgi:hypothetical protein
VRRIVAPSIEQGDPRIAGNKFAGGIRVVFPDLMEFLQMGLVVPHGKADEVQESVSNAAHRGNHNAESFVRLPCDNVADAPEASSIGDAAAAEFMDFPTSFRQQVRPAPAQSG